MSSMAPVIEALDNMRYDNDSNVVRSYRLDQLPEKEPLELFF